MDLRGHPAQCLSDAFKHRDCFVVIKGYKEPPYVKPLTSTLTDMAHKPQEAPALPAMATYPYLGVPQGFQNPTLKSIDIPSLDTGEEGPMGGGLGPGLCAVESPPCSFHPCSVG